MLVLDHTEYPYALIHKPEIATPGLRYHSDHGYRPRHAVEWE